MKKDLSSITDYYNAYLVSLSQKSDFKGTLDQKIENDWVKNFKPDTFEIDGNQGLTLESMRLVEMMSTSSNEKAKEKV